MQSVNLGYAHTYTMDSVIMIEFPGIRFVVALAPNRSVFEDEHIIAEIYIQYIAFRGGQEWWMLEQFFGMTWLEIAGVVFLCN